MPAVDTIQLRRGTAAAWTAANPILAIGEVGIETDTLNFKVGDGSTAWSSLGYYLDFANIKNAASSAQLPTLTAPGGAGSIAAVVYSQSFTAQTADIGSTAVTNSGAAGIYRVSYYLQDTTTALGAGAVTLNVAYTDSGGAKTQSSAAVVLTSLSGMASGSMVVQTASGNITFSTSHTGIFSTAQYRLDIVVERLV